MIRDLLIAVALNLLAPVALVGVGFTLWWVMLGFVGPWRKRPMTPLDDVMDENEKLVRETWQLVHRCDGSYWYYPEGTVLIQPQNHKWLEFPDWQAAAEFTRERLEEVRQVEREIEWETARLEAELDGVKESIKGPFSFAAAGAARHTVRLAEIARIIRRLESIRDDLKKGMKP